MLCRAVAVRSSVSAAFMAAAFFSGLSAFAGSGAWIYDGSSTWSTASRWNPAVVPGTAAGDVVYLTNNITANRTVTVNTTSRTVGALFINDVTSPYYGFTLATSGGATLTFNNSGADAILGQTNNASTLDTLSVPLVLADNLVVTNRGAFTVTASVSGSGKSLTKDGPGYLTLSGSNTYSGGTTVNGGVLSYLNEGARPGEGLTAVGSAGTLVIGVGAPGTFDAAALDALCANTFPNVSLNASAVVGVDTSLGAFTYGTSLSGSRGFAKFGVNNLVWPVANAHTGPTVIYNGVLELEHASALPGGTGTTGGSSPLVFRGGVLGLGVGDFSRSLASASTPSGVNFAGPGGWAAYNADRVVNLGGSGATVSWGTSNTGFGGQTLILGAPTATHTVELLNPLNLGTSTRTVQVEDGAAAVDAVISVPLSGSSNGNLYKSGSGTLVLTAVNTYVGFTQVKGGGTLQLAGSASIGTAGANTLTLGQQFYGAGTLQYDSCATSYFSTVNISQSNAATGTLNQTAGMISVAGNLNMTPTADCSSFLNLSGGTLAVGGMLAIAQRGTLPATFVLSGTGVLTAAVVAVPDYSNVPSNTKPSYGQFIQNGGSATVGTLVIANTSYDLNPHVGSYDLNGGTLYAGTITGGVATAGGINSSTFNFNGGTLKPTASGAGFMRGLTAAYVREGGALIDSDGYDITITQPLLHAAGAAASPLVKSGAGNLTLAGANSLIGPVTVNGGTLTLADDAQLGDGTLVSAVVNNGAIVFSGSADQTLAGLVSGSGSIAKEGAGTLSLLGVTPYSGDTTISSGALHVVSGGSLSNSAVTLTDGASLRLDVFAADGQWNCKSLAMAGTVTAALRFHTASISGTVAPVLINGDWVNNGTLNMTLDGAVVAVGTYPLVRYTGTMSGSGSLGSVTLPNGGVGTLVHNGANQTVDLVVSTAVSPLVWNGGSGTWDIGSTANWTGLRSTYLDGDIVLLDDTSTGEAPFTVSLSESVAPNNVWVSNLAKDYALVGPGALSGASGIYKDGAGALSLGAPNASSGGLTIGSGSGTVTAMLDVGQDGLGTGPVSIGAGSLLVLNNTNATAAAVAKANVFGGTGTLKVLFATNTTGRTTTLAGLSGFAGSVLVGSSGMETGDKLDISGADARDATVQIADGHTLQLGSSGMPVRFGGLTVRGVGNAEGGGALRFAAGASFLESPVTLLDDTTIGSDSSSATLAGAITGTAVAGATNVLTQGTTVTTAGLTVSGVIGDGSGGGKVSLVQTKGTLALSGANTFSGGTTVYGNGTLLIGAVDSLPVAGSLTLGGTNGAGNLVLEAFSQTVSDLSVASKDSSVVSQIAVGEGQVLTVGGANGVLVGIDNGGNSTTRAAASGNGSLNVTHAAAVVAVGKAQKNDVGGSVSSLDLSGLSGVTFGAPGAPVSEIRIGFGQRCGGSLTLSDTDNQVMTPGIHVGNSNGGNQGSSSELVLGAGENVIAADTLNVGLYKAVGTVRFASQASESPGTLTLGGLTRGTVDMVLGSKKAIQSSTVPKGVLDLRGHVVQVTAGTVIIGQENNMSVGTWSTGGAAGALYFDAGMFTVTNLMMALKMGVNTGVNANASASLTIGGGEFVVTDGPITFGYQTVAGTASATNTILGGVFRSFADILAGPSNCTSVINLEGGTLDMTRHVIGQGAQTVTVFNVQSGTLMNVAEFNEGAPVVKEGAGTLALEGTNTYSGATVVNGGVLRLTGGSCLPPTADLYLSSGATCELDYAGELNIHALYIDGFQKKGALYGAASLPTYLTGSGYLRLPQWGSLMLLQ